MSVLTLKRLLAVVAVLLFADAAAASYPSPRTHARMAYDAESQHSVLFGGRVNVDAATGRSYASDETWAFAAKRWTQLFPEHNPGARSVHSMTYDSKDDRIVLFGGRRESEVEDGTPTFLNDTWEWDGSDWTEVATSSAPDPRAYAGIAYDSARDRVVIFGGEVLTADALSTNAIYDMWEFDGTDWTRIMAEGPHVRGPLLTYDVGRDEIIMLGLNDTAATVMYRYDAPAGNWVAVTPELLPPCVNEGLLTYRSRTGHPLYTGGICPTDNTGVVDTFEWDGTNWVKLTANTPGHASGQAFTYDELRDTPIMVGGVTLDLVSVPRSTTLLFEEGTIWRFTAVAYRPVARSLAGFRSDPERENLWLFGGLSADSSFYMTELWRYADGQWNNATGTGIPVECITPATAFDTNRKVLIVVCNGADVFEWNGTEWKTPDPDKPPTPRRFAGLVYDETLKKAVLFGGYQDDAANFRQDTWSWDGTTWTEVKNERPPRRSGMAMWYDPLLRKTVIYGGIGRPDIDSSVERYDDMWSFSGSGWTEMQPATTPDRRLGSAVSVIPTTGKVLLFGGLRANVDDDRVTQYYDGETWQWDGSANSWTKLTPARSPAARQNAMLGWDPVAQEMVLFGGYAGGLYYSDLWAWDGTTWTVRDVPFAGRRRGAGGH